jgi:phosphate transport system ATP-binding protein
MDHDKIVIRTEKLDLWFGEKHILKNIGASVFAHKITAMIGPSGCGKSTFLRTLNRMNDFISSCRLEGKVYYGAQDVYDKKTDVIALRREVGMVFQKPNPFPKSIYDNIAFGPRLMGERNRKKLDWLVEKSLKDAFLWNEVKDDLKKNALALSGGQQQRLCIARVLAVDPKVILMDEPCSALDPISTAGIEDLMQALRKRVTIVIVTHNMQQAARVSQYTGYFLLGRLVEFGPTGEIFTKPKDKRTEDYITGRFG